MPRLRLSVPIIVLALSLSALAAVAPAATGASAITPARSAVSDKPAQGYHVQPGVTFNSPMGKGDAQRSIIRKINSAISHTHRGDQIRIFSWKIWTYAGVTDLLRAQKRGVIVHAIMDKKNTIVEANPHFWRLKRGLAAGNKHRPKDRRSAAILCDHSCRGKGGAAHSKFFLFSKVGQSKDVYMAGSANWGDAAANLQWNDMFTFVGNEGIYNAGVKVFEQAWKDKPIVHPWTEYSASHGSVVVAWGPTTSGSRDHDRLLATLRKTHCSGATGGAGNPAGHTVIRSTPDVIRGDRGMAVATQLRRLWNHGCDVKIGYTVMGHDVSQLLKQKSGRGPVPVRHLAQDFDGDGVFDRYFHLKVMTVNGVIGHDTSATWMVCGSSNLSQLAQISDEEFMYFIDQPGITKRYQNHLSYWIDHFPQSYAPSATVARRVAAGAIDPYAKMEMD